MLLCVVFFFFTAEDGIRDLVRSRWLGDVYKRQRYEDVGIFFNAQLPNRLIKTYCALDSASEAMLRQAFTTLKLSARAYHRILKVARTIADLEGEEKISSAHIAEAIQYRSLDTNALGGMHG